MQFAELVGAYRKVFILDSRDWFAGCRDDFDPASDLVLTYDFALKREVEGMGAKVFYVDHLVDNRVMQQNNVLIYEFFRDWHLDADGNDIFIFEGIPFGMSFRLDFWNDYVFYIRARLCLERLKELEFESILVGTEIGLIETVLEEMGIPFSPVSQDKASNLPRYYFPIHDWMTEKIRRRGVKAHILNLFTWSLGSLMSLVDRALGQQARRPTIFVQDYHPTRKLIQRLREDPGVRVVAAFVTRQKIWSRYIPLWASADTFQPEAQRLMDRFRTRRCARLVLAGGIDVTESAYSIIERRVASRVADSVRILDCVTRYLDKNPVRMELLIANIGEIVTLVDCACKARDIPSFLIVNGLLSNGFKDESKYATVINAYSTSVKDTYFRGMSNVVCLGDPRMDSYPPRERVRSFDKDSFTVTIGASGHNSTDLNSYVAVEFEFMHDVLQALRQVKRQGVNVRIVIKVRANGYIDQYREFSNEFFPGIVDEILDKTSMKDVLERTDFYISIYSQTLFEASCMGIPCLYYKKDNEIMDPPFDGNSELVTVGRVDELVTAIGDLRNGHHRFGRFLQRSVMEKYIGPLDGGNVDRNLKVIYEFLNQTNAAVEN